MTTEYSVIDSNGDTIIPANDGDYFTIAMDEDYTSGEVFILTCDSTGNPMTATGGTFTVKSSPIEGQYLEPSNGTGVIDAALTGAEASYEVPLFNGRVIQTRITLAGVTGATHFKALHARHGGF